MSLILKGINLPKGKDEALLLLVLGDGTVAEQISTNRYEEITDAEAIQIPKGHGRIGDLDELQVNVTKVMTYGDALDEVKKAPAILESEENKNEFYYKRH